MKIWVTKYALTQGILLYDTNRVMVVGHHMIRIHVAGELPQHFHKGEWFTSEEAAIQGVKRMPGWRLADSSLSITQVPIKVEE